VLGVIFMYKASHGVIYVNYTTIPIILTLFVAVFMFVIGLLGIFAIFTNNRYMLIFVSTLNIATVSILIIKKNNYLFLSILYSYQSYLQQRSQHLLLPLNSKLKSMVILQLVLVRQLGKHMVKQTQLD
jgi:hypothetical protein